MLLPNSTDLPKLYQDCKRLSPQEQKQLQELLATEQRLRARLAIQDAHYWLTECTKTQDEQDQTDPYKPFPPLPYLPYVLDVLTREPIAFLEKSRTMMCSWIVSGWAAH